MQSRLPRVVFAVFLLAAASPQVLAAESPAAAPAAAETAPPHERFDLESAALKETRRITVYLPPDYAQDTSVRYPVLYMPDGGINEDFPHVTGSVERAIRAGKMRALIIVGIENTQRRRDLTGPTDIATDRAIAPQVGGSPAFRAFLRDELLPKVQARYRGNGETAIIGESLAGLFVLETCMESPELFDTCIALSPSLWWNDHALVRALPARLNARPHWRARWYLASANEDNIAPETAAFARALAAGAPAGLRWQYEPRPDLRHDTIYRTLAPVVLPQLFAP